MQSNVTVDIFTSGNGPGGVPAAAAVPCYLTPKGQSTLTSPYYTHVLYLPTGTTIADDFQPGTLTPGNTADVVYIPSGGSGSPYTVVLVREWSIGSPLDHLEALLIKGIVQPNTQGNPAGGCQVGTPVAQSVTSSGDNVSVGHFKWTQKVFDTNGFTTTAASNGQLVAPGTGLYLATVNLQVNTANIGGYFQVFFQENGSGELDEMTVPLISGGTNPNNNNGQAGLATLVSMSENSYLTVGANLYLASTPAGQTWAGLYSLVKVG
jgi:hypothetical protein